MSGAPSTTGIAALESVIVGAGALAFGYLLVDAILGSRPVDRLTRWALSFTGLIAYAFVVMLLHIATGGEVLTRPWLVRSVTVAVAGALLLVKLRGGRRPLTGQLTRAEVWIGLGLVAASVVVWGIPVARVLPLRLTPDIDLHMGWATQLMIGESTPSSVVTGDIPNYYPWLFHAAVALLAWVTPGERAYYALGPLQLIQVAGGALAALALGKHITGKMSGGLATSLFVSVSGGLGVFMLGRLDVFDRVGQLGGTRIAFLGDVFARRPYNFSFNNLAPSFPRDVSFSLLVAFLLVLLLASRAHSRAGLAGAGGILGLVGLTGAEALIVGTGVAVVVLLVSKQSGRLVDLAVLLAAVLVVYGTWLLPVIVTYLRLGFVNITHVAPVVEPPLNVLATFGIATPLAVYGAILIVPRTLRDAGARIVLAVAVVAGGIISFNAVPLLLGQAFLTLGRDHRYWALFDLSLALLAGVGTAALVDRLKPRRAVIAFLIALVGSISVASPLLGSLFYEKQWREDPLLATTLRGRHTLLSALAPSPDRRCVVAVAGNTLAREMFAFTGYRMVQWVYDPIRSNRARIRWREIYRYVPDDEKRFRASNILTLALGGGARWTRVAEEFDVNYVVVSPEWADAPAIAGRSMELVSAGSKEVLLVRAAPCPRGS